MDLFFGCLLIPFALSLCFSDHLCDLFKHFLDVPIEFGRALAVGPFRVFAQILVDFFSGDGLSLFFEVRLIAHQHHTYMTVLIHGGTSQFVSICLAQKSTVTKVFGSERSKTIMTASLFL